METLQDQKLSRSLDWEMHFKIILEITRRLVYLHHDSKLRIIHRDLKTCNILLDKEMILGYLILAWQVSLKAKKLRQIQTE